ncbi:MAG TPA: PEP/pyruvate-binding domain-containing protein, partial [Thermodesulfovibrionales bacterium]|nr:PEP/pyruvate-binding domain-containing protein [Thermodesulfovibrionales bacterium]
MSTLTSFFRSGILATGRRLLGLVPERKTEDFRDLFNQFRQVLELHNIAAERIADMGEKLSGEYIFDIVYVRQAYAELQRVFSDFIRGFAAFTRDRYPGLLKRLDAIDNDIRQLIDHDETPGSDLVVPLSAAGTNRMRDVGGKMANLAEAGKLPGITIPRGFVITTRAFDDFLFHNGLSEKISLLSENWENDASALDDIRSAVLAGTIPPALSAALGKALAESDSVGPHGYLAVRSSAVGEDSEYSFAGQFETLLNVPEDAASVFCAYKQV